MLVNYNIRTKDVNWINDKLSKELAQSCLSSGLVQKTIWYEGGYPEFNDPEGFRHTFMMNEESNELYVEYVEINSI